MKGRPDVAGKVFGALGRHNINISAIAQGASERNISCVVDAVAAVARAQRDPSGVLRDAQAARARGGRRRQHRRRAAAAAARAAGRTCSTQGFDVNVVARGQQQAVRADARRHRPRPAGARRSTPPTGGWIRGALAQRDRQPGADQRGAHRLHGRVVHRRRLSGVHQREPAHHHAEQARERAAVAALRGADGAAGRAPEALPVRDQRRRRTADHVDAARSDRQRRRDHEGRGHSLGDAQLSVQHVRRHGAVQLARSRGAPAWGTPSRIRARICRARTWRASC